MEQVPENQIHQQDSQNPDAPEFSKRKIPFWLIGVIAVLIITIPAAGYYFSQHPKPAPQPKKTISISPTPTVSPWKTYINEKQGYSIQYPTNLFIQDTQACGYDTTHEYFALFKKHSGKYLCGSDEPYVFGIYKEKFNPADYGTCYTESKSPVLIGGVSGEQIIYTYNPDKTECKQNTGIRTVGIITLTHKGEDFFIRTIDLAPKPGNYEIYTMLGTFRFTDVVDLSSWKTYTFSPQFTFQYPPDWSFKAETHSAEKINFENKPLTTTAQGGNLLGGRVQGEIDTYFSTEPLCGVDCKNISEKDFYNLNNSKLWRSGDVGGGGSGTTKSKPAEVVIAGKKAIYQVSHPTFASESGARTDFTDSYYIYMTGGGIVLIQFQYSSEHPDTPLLLTTFKQILSTFKFTDIDSTPLSPTGSQVMCTMEAKQCPDGSWVGRSGPNCAFAACSQ